MCAAMIKPPTKAQIEARNQRNHEKEICRDIRKIEDALKSADPNAIKELHRYLDGKYQSCITGWGDSMYEYVVGRGFDYGYLDTGALRENLSMMKPKLEAFLHGWNMSHHSTGLDVSHDVNVTVNNTVNISISFEEARKQVEDMSSLTDEQTQEVLERIDEIERVINTDASKKSKWEKIKPVLIWLADKSYDLGKTILPLLLKIQE